MNRQYKKSMLVFAALILAVALAYFNLGNNRTTANNVDYLDENAVVHQNIVGMYDEPVEVIKVYYGEQLIGVIKEPQIIEDTRKRAYVNYYQENFPNSTIVYDEDIFFYKEKTYYEYEDKDYDIAYYLYANDMFLVDCYRVEIGDDTVIYVKELEDFREALRNVSKLFINEDVFVKLENNEKIVSLTAVGEQDVNIYIEEKIRATNDKAKASDIYTSYDEIVNYLSFGKNNDLEYATVRKYDTISGFALRYGLTAEQLVLINPSLTSVNQAIAEGMELNITYFKPPLHIIVEKERFAEEVIYAPDTRFINDSSLAAGEVVVETDGQNGLRETLYKEIYVNGKRTSYTTVSTRIAKQAIQKVVRLGAMAIYYGDNEWHLPVDNPKIICDFYCYAGHTGIDIQNRYQPYSNAYACADGIVIQNSWWNDAGWFVTLDHGDGVNMLYCHFRSRSPLVVGQRVVQGQFIGYVGMTGHATAPHVHVQITINGVRADPCTLLPCDLAR